MNYGRWVAVEIVINCPHRAWRVLIVNIENIRRVKSAWRSLWPWRCDGNNRLLVDNRDVRDYGLNDYLISHELPPQILPPSPGSSE